MGEEEERGFLLLSPAVCGGGVRREGVREGGLEVLGRRRRAGGWRRRRRPSLLQKRKKRIASSKKYEDKQRTRSCEGGNWGGRSSGHI